MQELEKKRILRSEMNKYKVLREQISHDKTAKAPKKAAKPTTPIELKKEAKQPDAEVSQAPKVEMPAKAPKEALTGREMSEVSYSEEIATAVKEIKRFVQAEFKMLREELRLAKK
jgi:hypothetical protein